MCVCVCVCMCTHVFVREDVHTSCAQVACPWLHSSKFDPSGYLGRITLQAVFKCCPLATSALSSSCGKVWSKDIVERVPPNNTDGKDRQNTTHTISSNSADVMQMYD